MGSHYIPVAFRGAMKSYPYGMNSSGPVQPKSFTHTEHRPFSIMLVNLAFNTTRNSRIKPKKC